MLSLTEFVSDFQNNALRDTHKHTYKKVYLLVTILMKMLVGTVNYKMTTDDGHHNASA